MAGLAAGQWRLLLASVVAVVALVRLELFGLVEPIRQESTKVSKPMAMLTRPYFAIAIAVAALPAFMSRSAS